MYKVLWNHLDQNLKKAPAPAVFLALLTAGWSAAGILAGLLVCLELQTELMVKLTVILCAGGYAGLIPGFFGGIFIFTEWIFENLLRVLQLIWQLKRKKLLPILLH